jgi:small subunit ribosomal protein S6
MKQYELLIVLPGTMEEAMVQTMMTNVKNIVTKHGAENVVMHDRGKSRLAYPIRHIRYGYFHIVRFNAEGEATQLMQKEFALEREILRALITAYDPKDRDATQKKLNRKEEGPMRTLASVFERFGGEEKKGDAEEEDKPSPRKDSSRTSAPAVSEDTEPAQQESSEDTEPAKIEDIDKKLDQLLEDDLSEV